MRAFLAPIGQDTLTQFRRDVPPKEWAFRATVLCVLHRHIPNEDQPHHVQNDTQFFEGNASRRANSSGGEGCCRQTVGNMISEPTGGSRYRKACGQFSPRMPLLLLSESVTAVLKVRPAVQKHGGRVVGGLVQIWNRASPSLDRK